MKTNTHQPVERIRRGALSAAIWANEADSGRTFYSASFQKTFRGTDDKWHNLHSYNLGDLPALAVLIDETYRRVCELVSTDNGDTSATGKRPRLF
ncbi:MAG: hypothetical protein ACT452_05215 [Microthrixaceae bacterium]